MAALRNDAAAKTLLRWAVAVSRKAGWLTQGSSCLATLGFGTEFRWDSQMVHKRDG